MKKLLFLLLFALVTSLSQAQIVESAELSASANILSALSIETLTNLSFGNISQTTVGDVVIDPKGLNTNNTSYVGTTAEIGTMKIVGSSSQTINVTFPSSIVLSSNANNVTLTLDVNGSDNNSNQSTSTDLSPGSDITTNSGTGFYYLWIGGSIGTLTNQAVGLYTGTAAFEVEYN